MTLRLSVLRFGPPQTQHQERYRVTATACRKITLSLHFATHERKSRRHDKKKWPKLAPVVVLPSQRYTYDSRKRKMSTSPPTAKLPPVDSNLLVASPQVKKTQCLVSPHLLCLCFRPSPSLSLCAAVVNLRHGGRIELLPCRYLLELPRSAEQSMLCHLSLSLSLPFQKSTSERYFKVIRAVTRN